MLSVHAKRTDPTLYFALLHSIRMNSATVKGCMTLATCISTRLAFTHLSLTPVASREKDAVCSCWSAVWTEQHGENSSNSSSSFSKYWPWKIVYFFMHLTAHFSVPPRVTEHGSIFSQDDCFVPLLPRGPRWHYLAGPQLTLLKRIDTWLWAICLLHLFLAVSEANITLQSQDEQSHTKEEERWIALGCVQVSKCFSPVFLSQKTRAAGKCKILNVPFIQRLLWQEHNWAVGNSLLQSQNTAMSRKKWFRISILMDF